MRFEWDDAKAEANEAKHGVTFEEAAELLSGDFLELRADTRGGERRSKAIARDRGEYFAVVYTERQGATRVISARRATKEERACYDKYLG